MHTMTENILRWYYDSEGAQEIVDYLKAADARGRIKRLTFMPGGSASFASWGKENAFVQQLSEDNPEMFLTHLYINDSKGTCGCFRWQYGHAIINDTPTDETELAGLVKMIKEEIAQAEDYDGPDQEGNENITMQ